MDVVTFNHKTIFQVDFFTSLIKFGYALSIGVGVEFLTLKK